MNVECWTTKFTFKSKHFWMHIFCLIVLALLSATSDRAIGQPTMTQRDSELKRLRKSHWPFTFQFFNFCVQILACRIAFLIKQERYAELQDLVASINRAIERGSFINICMQKAGSRNMCIAAAMKLIWAQLLSLVANLKNNTRFEMYCIKTSAS